MILLKLPEIDPSGLIVTFAPESGTKLVTNIDESVFIVIAPCLIVEVSTEVVVALEVLSVWDVDCCEIWLETSVLR